MKEKHLSFNLSPDTLSDEKMLVISAISLEIRFGGEKYLIQFAPPTPISLKLKLRDRGRVDISVDDIVMIRPTTNKQDARSNNKEIVLNGRGSDILCDFSASNKMADLMGDDINHFLEINRSVWVNKKYIKGLTPIGNVVVSYAGIDGALKTEELVGSTSKRMSVRREINRVLTNKKSKI